MHAVRIPPDVLDRIAARRGKLHPFDRIEGPKTALVVIDLQNAFLLPGMPAAVTLDGERERWSVFFDHFGSPSHSAAEQKSLSRGDPGHELFGALDVLPEDL